MKIKISPTGPELSQMTYGVWRMLNEKDGATTSALQKKVDICLEHGITTFDHADIYGDYECERVFGDFLRAHPSYKNKIQIVTKCGIALLSKKRPEHWIKHYNYSQEHIQLSIENSLKNLGVDHLDMVLFHRPSPLMNPDELAEITSSLTRQGKVRHWGVSNATSAQCRMLSSRMDIHTNQIEANPLFIKHFLDGTIDYCVEKKISPMFWSPLAGGRLFKSKEFFDSQSPGEQKVVHTLGILSEKYNQPVDVVVYNWLLQHPSKPIIVLGTNKTDRIQSSVSAFNFKMDLQDWFSLWQAALRAEVP